MNDLDPNPEELKALRQFVSPDETRAALATLWAYVEVGGMTHLASDGHTLVMRRAGTHAAKSIVEIEKLPAIPLDNPNAVPLMWSSVVSVPDWEGPNLEKRGINPAYFARVALVEKAAGKRAASEYKPRPGISKKLEKLERDTLRGSKFSVWTLGRHALDAWYFHIGGEVVWEGLIMPRRV